MYNKILYLILIIFSFQVLAINPMPGGKYGIDSNSVQAFSLPMKGLTKKEITDFMVGNSLFRSNWVVSPSSVTKLQGLGPTFIARSCSSCHQNDGRSKPNDNGETGVGLLFRISVTKNGKDFYHDPIYGDQIQTNSIMNVASEAETHVEYTEIKNKFNDGEEYVLTKPNYKIKNLKFGDLNESVVISPRVAPAIIGMGLIESISEKDILNNADPEDMDKDGISGRPNVIIIDGKKQLGRFGWKANQPTLKVQDAGALLGDMGITTSIHPKQNCNYRQTECINAHNSGIEMNDEDLNRLVFYTAVLGVPKSRIENKEIISKGEILFQNTDCIKCHVPEYKTSKNSFKQFSEQRISPYSDFLLHDMGDELADNRPDFEANGKEWRTPPLWGIGLTKVVNRHMRLLHDGRARGISEAILWHGGEASSAREKYKKLPKEERKILIQFVESL
jgi:CxxC motif-containing protein (DUF1111 family)